MRIKPQSLDALEALTNSVIGLALSWAVTYFVLGFGALDSAGITAAFFAMSFTRGWIVRSVFRWLSTRIT